MRITFFHIYWFHILLTACNCLMLMFFNFTNTDIILQFKMLLLVLILSITFNSFFKIFLQFERISSRKEQFDMSLKKVKCDLLMSSTVSSNWRSFILQASLKSIMITSFHYLYYYKFQWMLKRVWKDEISTWNLIAVILLNLNERFLFRIVFKFLLNLNFKNKSCSFIRIKKSQNLSERYLNISISTNMNLLQAKKL